MQDDERVHVLCEMYNVQLEKFEHDVEAMQKHIDKQYQHPRGRTLT